MYLGRLCETGPADEVYARPRHPYTVELLDAVPRVEQASLGKRRPGDRPDHPAADPASPASPPSGCRFRTRCPRAQARCAAETPALAAVPGDGTGHRVACHFPLEIAGDKERCAS
jgi:oligopeptide transport system ATP-binding protein